MNWEEFVMILVWVSVGAIGVYDTLAFFWHGVQATISRQVLAFASRHPIFPLALGVLLGHLFWPQPVPSLSYWFKH